MRLILLVPICFVVVAGSVFEDQCLLISDTTVLSFMGASCDHIDHVKVQFSYTLIVAFTCVVGHLTIGIWLNR